MSYSGDRDRGYGGGGGGGGGNRGGGYGDRDRERGGGDRDRGGGDDRDRRGGGGGSRGGGGGGYGGDRDRGGGDRDRGGGDRDRGGGDRDRGGGDRDRGGGGYGGGGGGGYGGGGGGDRRGDGGYGGGGGGGGRYGDRGGDRGRGGYGGGEGRGNGGGFRGGRDGGRGGGRGGGGGKNRHMGEIGAVNSLLNGIGMSDAEILHVVDPPLSDRERNQLIGGSIVLPPPLDWRLSPSIGKLLSDNMKIRANHFRMDVSMIPREMYQYHIHFYKIDRDGSVQKEDCAGDEDYRVLTKLMMSLRSRHPEWELDQYGEPIGLTYDGKSALFTSAGLPFTTRNDKDELYHAEEIAIPKLDGTDSNKRYEVRLTLIAMLNSFHDDGSPAVDEKILRALDTALFSFARWMVPEDSPAWHLVGSKVFRANDIASTLANSYLLRRGYYAGMKMCMAGLVLVTDMAVSCFTAGGPLIDVMAAAGGFRNTQEMLSTASRSNGLHDRIIRDIESVIKGAKCQLTHIGHSKKVKGLGPIPTSEETTFHSVSDNRDYTVATYFESMATRQSAYKAAVDRNGSLLYPFLPTLNVGTKSKPILIPVQLIVLAGGQCKARKMTGEMTAAMIKSAAVRPDERFRFLTGSPDSESVLNVIQMYSGSKAFGLSSTNTEPMHISAKLLPQAKLQYRNGIADPLLNGAWNIDRPQYLFSHPPPLSASGKQEYMYGILIVSDKGAGQNGSHVASDFGKKLESDANAAGVKLISGGKPFECTGSDKNIRSSLITMKSYGARIILVMMQTECYSIIKFVADTIGIETQCLKWKKVEQPPRGYHVNVMLKVNTKMGGCNHTLVSRLGKGQNPVAGAAVFQDPPASMAWILDEPCMLVGIDVSHGEPGSDRDSLAAVVGTVDGRLSQYVAQLSAQSPRTEMVSALTEAMKSLLESFKERNGVMPKRIVVFRDGVSDGQFSKVNLEEIPQIKEAIELMGSLSDSVKISCVICTKSHHTRLAFDENGTYVNLSPGIVADASGRSNSISSSTFNEFYLNSHVAIQGTCKPTKYSLIYDEIGFKISELELLTYWTTYLYSRCNRSVSIATPAYYAHWAANRAKDYVNAGGAPADLRSISKKWSEPGRFSTMFFI